MKESFIMTCAPSTAPRPQTCRWAAPTMRLGWPFWLDSLSWPWSCALKGRLRLLSGGDYCRNCSSWQERHPEDAPPSFDVEGKILRDTPQPGPREILTGSGE